MMKSKKAVIFDLDGTLVRTQESHIEAYRTILGSNNIPFTDEELLAKIGKTSREIIRELVSENKMKGFTDRDIERIAKEKQAEYRRITTPSLLPGAQEMMAKLHAMGVDMAVATSTSRKNLEHSLKSTGIDRYVRTFVTGDDVSRAKPDPEIFLKAAEVLGKSPSDCIVFEDSLNGVMAVRAAGMKCVGVTTGIHSREELEPECDMVFGSLVDALPPLLGMLSA